MSQVIVDDQDSRVQYSGSWQHLPSTPGVVPPEYDYTKSGAAETGLTATLRFTGTQVSVFGSQGSIDVYGQPVTTYEIDGQLVATYRAPVIQPGYFTAGTTFFTSGTLSAGEHTIVVTNVNGTKPNVLWLDGFRYTPSASTPSSAPPPAAPASSSSPQAPSAPSSAPASNVPSTPSTPVSQAPQQQSQAQASSAGAQSSASQASQAPSASTVLAPNQSTLVSYDTLFPSGSSAPTPSASSSNGTASDNSLGTSGTSTKSSSRSVGPIVGGVIGGLGILALVFLAFVIWRRRQSRPPSDDDFVKPPPSPPHPEMRHVEREPHPFEIRPFGTWREQEAPYTGGIISGSGKGRTATPNGSSSDNPFTDSAAASPQGTSSPSGSEIVTESVDPPSGVSEPLVATAQTGGSEKQKQRSNPSGSEKSQAQEGLRRLPPTPDQVSHPIPPTPAPVRSTPTAGESSRASVPPIVRHHEDSGIRLGPRVVDVPPAYTRA